MACFEGCGGGRCKQKDKMRSDTLFSNPIADIAIRNPESEYNVVAHVVERVGETVSE